MLPNHEHSLSLRNIALQTDEPAAAGKGKKGSKDEGKGKKKKK